MNMDTLEHKVVLITGASRGIGAATAIRLAEDGYQVAVNYLKNKDAAEGIVDTIVKSGGQALAMQADISQQQQVVALFERVDAEMGPLMALVNNAGILMPQIRVEEMTQQRINSMLCTNVTGYFLCCGEAVKRMSTAHGGQGGSIVNVSSAASRIGAAGEYVDYAASKGAIDTLTIGLAKEVAAENIRVNCVRPGFIYTDMHTDGGEPDRVERIKQTLPMRRGGRPEEVAAAIAWLLSEQSSYSTGTFIEVSGGR